MKSIIPLAIALVTCAPAIGAEFSLNGTYGNPAGCAMAQKAETIPSGKAYTASTKSMQNGDANCTVLSATDVMADPAGMKWRVKLSCEAGDENAELGTVDVIRSTDGSSVAVHVVEGVGPTGNLKACQAVAQ